MIYCPVDCKYCLLSKINKRKQGWDNGKRIGVNNTNVFLGRLPGDPPIDKMGFDFSVLEHDFVGFGIVDCFWDKFRGDLKFMLNNMDKFKIKKLVLISKIPINNELLSLLKDKRVVVVYSLTGLDKFERIENTTTRDRLKSMEQLVKAGIDTFPLLHPYIDGVSDVSFLSELPNIGINCFDFKGFRYNKELMSCMSAVISEDILDNYITNNEDEVLFGETKIYSLAYINNLRVIKLKDYVISSSHKGLSLSRVEAEQSTNKLFNSLNSMAHICSSSNDNSEVWESTVRRRMI